MLAIVVWQMILCYKRSRDSRRDDNSNNSARYESRSSRPSATARSGFATGARSGGTTIGSPAAIEMGATEPVVGIPVWINTDGVMNGLAGGSPGPLSPSTMGAGGAGREGGEPAGGDDGHEDGEDGPPRPPANRAAECAPNGDSL